MRILVESSRRILESGFWKYTLGLTCGLAHQVLQRCWRTRRRHLVNEINAWTVYKQNICLLVGSLRCKVWGQIFVIAFNFKTCTQITTKNSQTLQKTLVTAISLHIFDSELSRSVQTSKLGCRYNLMAVLTTLLKNFFFLEKSYSQVPLMLSHESLTNPIFWEK